MSSSAPGGAVSSIRTPDRRLRIFISSTIEELGVERLVAREAIEQLRQTPVVFESGARPYSPRAVYRQMLQQCDIFVGIYWQSYGWVAPDMEISGLEDEYALSRGMPRLLYIKSPAPERAPRLKGLLDRIRDAGDVAYKRFTTADELRELIAEDLGLLLAERFGDSGSISASRVIPRLPLSPTPFVGRERVIDDAVALLRRDSTRLLTLTGPGGVGKTRLVLEVARTTEPGFGDGVAFVDLGRVSDASLVPSAILQALGLQEEGNQDPVNLVRWYLADKTLLLILDNFEHLLPAAPLVADLLTTCHSLKILATSRAPLQLRWEHELPVTPLTIPPLDPLVPLATLVENESVELFVHRAQAVRPEFELTEANAQPVVEICRRLDGLPLAIELAAAQIRLFSEPTNLLNRLEPRLPLLVGGPRDAPARQRTMRHAIAWSYDLLSDAEQSLFRRLGVFVGGCTLDATEAIAAAGESIDDALTVLDALVEANLVQTSPGSKGEPRFEMLETLREFALEELAGSRGEQDVTHLAHARWFLDWILQLGPEFTGPHQLQTLTRIELEISNLYIALAYCETSGDYIRGLETVGVLWRYWYHRGLFVEGRQWLTRLFPDDAKGVPQQIMAMALEGRGGLAFAQGDFSEALNLYQTCYELYIGIDNQIRALRVLVAIGNTVDEQGQFKKAHDIVENALPQLRQLDDTSGVAAALNYLGRWELDHGDLNRAVALLTKSKEAYAVIGDQIGLAIAILNIGVAEEKRGDFQAAEDAFEEAVSLGQAMRTPFLVASSLHNLGNLASDYCDYPKAEKVYRESLGIKRDLGNLKDTATTLNSLGNLALDLQNIDLALDCFEEIASIGENVGDVECTVWALNGKGTVKQFLGIREEAAALYKEALRLSRNANYQVGVAMALNNLITTSKSSFGESMAAYGECLSIFADLGDPSGTATVQHNLARLAIRQNDFRTSLSLFQAALGNYRLRGERLHVISCLSDVGNWLATQGRLLDTTLLLAVANRVREEVGVSVPPNARLELEGRLGQLRDKLGIEMFARQWKAGVSWPLDEAISFALEVRFQE